MTTQSMLSLYNGCGASRYLNRPECWGRGAFNSGVLPTEGLINGRFPGVTGATLKRLAPTLKRLPQRYKIN